MSSLVCLHRIHRRRMYVKFSVPTQDTEETNLCQAQCVYTGYTEDKCMSSYTEETNVCKV